ncbi:MAG: ClpXP protease specificity-enhancing factor SspB [Bauldia sp.]
MAEDLIRYDILAQDALRGVVRKVLSEVARTTLPGDHHFFISFATTAPGVRVSTRLLSQYPEEMTIVLQHQYWDLVVTEHAMEVGLSFNGIPERLLIPFSAVKQFLDPSVGFKIEFNMALAPRLAEPLAEVAAPAPVVALEKKAEAPAAARDKEKDKDKEDAVPAAAAQVVSLDAFRKK